MDALKQSERLNKIKKGGDNMKVKDILTTTRKTIYIDKDGNTIALRNKDFSTSTEKVEEMEIKEIQARGNVLRIQV